MKSKLVTKVNSMLNVNNWLSLPRAHLLRKRLYPTTTTTTTNIITTKNIPYYLDASHLDLTSTQYSLNDISFYPSYIPLNYHEAIIRACLSRLRRIVGKHYETGHFDGVITRYRECNVSRWGSGAQLGDIDPENKTSDEDIVGEILRKVRQDWNHVNWKEPHVLELASDGEIRAHVDNLEASGRVVAGLCLGSPAVIIFREKTNPNNYFRLLTEPGCFYFQKDSIRYNFTHEIPKEDHTFRGVHINRDRRISIMLRGHY